MRRLLLRRRLVPYNAREEHIGHVDQDREGHNELDRSASEQAGGERAAARRGEQTQALQSDEYLDEEVALGKDSSYHAIQVEVVHLDPEGPFLSVVARAVEELTELAALAHELPHADEQIDGVDNGFGEEATIDRANWAQLCQHEPVDHVDEHGRKADDRQHERPPTIDENA